MPHLERAMEVLPQVGEVGGSRGCSLDRLRVLWVVWSSDPESHPKVGFESFRVSGFGFRVSIGPWGR